MKKIKSKETIERLRGEHGIIDDQKCMAELLNNRFQQVFSKESVFEKLQVSEEGVHMKEINMTKWEICKLIEELEEEKAKGLDEVLGNILKA